MIQKPDEEFFKKEKVDEEKVTIQHGHYGLSKGE